MKKFSALLLALVLALCLTSCGGKDDMASLLKSAWQAIGAPNISRAYHYQYDGYEEIAVLAEYPLADTFGLTSVPQKGHVFVLEASSDRYLVLLNDNGVVLAHDGLDALLQDNSRLSEQVQEYARSTNEDYEDGLISDTELQRRRQEIDRMLDEAMASSKRAVALAYLNACAVFSPVTEKAQANSWHELPTEMIESLFIY